MKLPGDKKWSKSYVVSGIYEGTLGTFITALIFNKLTLAPIWPFPVIFIIYTVILLENRGNSWKKSL